MRTEIRVKIFEHNIDLKHTAKKMLTNKSLTVLNGADNVPDFDPREHLWRDLKVTVHRYFPSNLMEFETSKKHAVYCTDPGVQSL